MKKVTYYRISNDFLVKILANHHNESALLVVLAAEVTLHRKWLKENGQVNPALVSDTIELD